MEIKKWNKVLKSHERGAYHMATISNAGGQPKNDLYALSHQCMSELPEIKKQIADKYLKEAPQLAREQSMWTRSKIGRELASNAYKEFEQTMKSKFSSPDYDYFLKCSIVQQHQYFHSDLAERIEKILEQLNLSEE